MSPRGREQGRSAPSAASSRPSAAAAAAAAASALRAPPARLWPTSQTAAAAAAGRPSPGRAAGRGAHEARGSLRRRAAGNLLLPLCRAAGQGSLRALARHASPAPLGDSGGSSRPRRA